MSLVLESMTKRRVEEDTVLHVLMHVRRYSDIGIRGQ